MVAGDLVNTASRVQAVAEAGAVYVGESTRRAAELTVVYEEAGSFELKGKDGLTPLWRALRVVSGLRGALKSQRLEAPFVGRQRELEEIKDLFHTCADERKARLVSVSGIAGIGKSRLAWEFYKYFDGIADTVYWHRGRCVPYGEGVTYWALADMVRMRCRIAEDEDFSSGLAKLRSTLEEHLLDPDDRSFVEPRLAQLLGFVESRARDKQDLFAAWRLFFERLAETYPTVLVFEDMQWADASLLDFVEYLLDWSRNSPLFVVTLSRPELLERRPTWGAGQRSFTSLYLGPLSESAMRELLAGLVPGLPDGLRGQILERAEGVPLYAVETVRMLLDRGLLVQEGSAYHPTGPVDELEVPETLHALIAARLDGLPADERRLLEDGAVLGKSFTREALGAVSGLDASPLDELLASLVRKEVLSVQADLRSPEHGQYGFLQDLVRHVAYETLSLRERRTRHLAAADYLLATPAAEEDEVVEVVASHYLAAYEAAPDSQGAAEIREKARDMLARGGERAQSLAASVEARRYFEQAAALATSPSERARLLDRAGWMASFAGDPDSARALLEEAIALYEEQGDTHAAARVLGRLGHVDAFTGRRAESLVRLERAFGVIARDEADEDLARLAAALSTGYWFSGDVERAAERAELALDIAEAHGYAEALTIALRAKGAVAESRGHPTEAYGLVKQALEHDLTDATSTCYFILSDRCFRTDRYGDALGYLDESLALSRKLGRRPHEWATLAERTYPLFMLGRWDECLDATEEFTQEMLDAGGVVLSLLTGGLEVYLHRGETEKAKRLFAMFSRIERSTDVQDQGSYFGALAALRHGEGRLAEAVEAGQGSLEPARTLGPAFQGVKQGVVHALEAALELGDTVSAEELFRFVEELPPGRRPRFLEAHADRLRARTGRDESGLGAAAAGFRELGLPFWIAVTLLEHGELTGSEPSLREAGDIFARLRAVPWSRRVAQAAEATGTAEAVAGRA
jgi:tetratricopeptide (TPR) repeat protein